MRGLIDRKWLQSRSHKDLRSKADFAYANPQLAEFLGRLIRKAARMGIPLRIEGQATSHDVGYVIHSRRGRELTAKEWEVLAHLGREIGRQYRLPVTWGGLRMPAVWMVPERRQDAPPP